MLFCQLYASVFSSFAVVWLEALCCLREGRKILVRDLSSSGFADNLFIPVIGGLS